MHFDAAYILFFPKIFFEGSDKNYDIMKNGLGSKQTPFLSHTSGLSPLNF